MIPYLALSPVTPFAIGLALTWLDLISSEPFDQLTYALEYARGHVAQDLWTPARAAAFVRHAWQSALPELLWRVIGYTGLNVGPPFVQRYWRL